MEGAFDLPTGWADAPHQEEWSALPPDPYPTRSSQPALGVKERTAPWHLSNDLLPSSDDSFSASVQHVPLISWGQCLMAKQTYEELRSGPTYPFAHREPRRFIAIEMNDDSMQSSVGQSFPAGTVLVFDLDLEPAHGRFVLFKGPDEKAHFRQYVLDVGKLRLIPLNPRYQTIPAPKHADQYLGVLVCAMPPPIYKLTEG